MRISVVIPTYNGASKITNLLDALMIQSVKADEVVVVVDGSSDNTTTVLAQYSSELNIRAIVQENGGRSLAKNRGIREAAGELLIFFDDDIVPSVDCIKMHQEFNLKNENCIVGGNVVEEFSDSKTDIQNYKAGLTKIWFSKYPEGPIALNRDNFFLSAANFSAKKELMVRLGAFNNQLNDAEDWDLAYRAIESSVFVYFDKSNVAFHNDPITCRSYIRRQREYLTAHRKLLELFPSRPTRNRINKDTRYFKLKKVWYFFFSFTFWVTLIDSNSILLVLPHKIRYKIYDYVIHSLSYIYPQVKI